MVWLLWILVLLLGITGWISRLDAFWGDDGIRDVHAALAQALQIAVAVHFTGVAIMAWRWRENLVGHDHRPQTTRRPLALAGRATAGQVAPAYARVRCRDG